ncbi:MAG: hypothetical protein HQL23_03135 [Candidatus Omnitrophica bacterium]|nr:hypothetical protein [Candidatus Omnitrophota bacterium]
MSLSWTETAAAATLPKDAKFISQSVPDTMVAGQSYAVSVVMQNSGYGQWIKYQSYRLASQNYPGNDRWGLSRIELPKEVIESGETVNFTFNITAPSQPSLYNFQWKMMHEGVQWFGEITPNKTVTVRTINAPQLTGVGGNKQVTLNWSPVVFADSYKVYIGTGSGVYGPAISPNNLTTYTAGNLLPATKYYCAVSALSSGGEGPKSNEKSGLTLPAGRALALVRGPAW